MSYVVLDIGAGSRAFGKDFSRLNRGTRMLVLCGEPEWGFGPLFRPISEQKVQTLIGCESTGVKRVVAEYEAFGLADNSLDLVTLNAPHPFMPSNVASELSRCVKSGGLFFSSFPKYDFGNVGDDFSLVAEGRWRHDTRTICVRDATFPSGRTIYFPQSPTVRSNIIEHAFGNPRSRGSSYIYFDGISPGWRLWRKN